MFRRLSPRQAHPPSTYLGYQLVGADGSVYPFGSVLALGDLSGARLARPVVGVAKSSDGLGYWLAASDGGIFTFGDARFFGSTGNVRLNKPIVGMASTPMGGVIGWWRPMVGFSRLATRGFSVRRGMCG